VFDDDLYDHSWDTFAEDTAILDQLELEFFRVSRDSIRPYEPATLSWEVKGPVDRVNLALRGEAIFDDPHLLRRVSIQASGSQAVSPLVTTPYVLRAERGRAVRRIGYLEVQVDTSEVKIAPIPANAFEDRVADFVGQLFNGTGQVTTRGDSKAALREHGLVIDLPLKLDVNNWFDADIDITLDFSISSHRSRFYQNRALVLLQDATVDVSWALAEHVVSLGITGPVQAVAEKLLEVVLEDMMATQLSNDLARALTEAPTMGINAQLATMGRRGRPFLLHSLDVFVTGIDIAGCPDPRP
jgi:hypothetical protein